MRLASVLPLLVACATPPPSANTCDAATCLPRCNEYGIRIRDEQAAALGTPALTDTTLTDAEWAAFGDELRAIRRGWQPTVSTRVGICRGAERCEVPLGMDVRALGPGPHIVAIELAPPPAPPVAEVRVRYREACRVQQMIDGEVTEGVLPYTVEQRVERADDGQPQSLVLRTLPAVSDDTRMACGYVIEVFNPVVTDTYEGSYVLELPPGRARAFDEALHGVTAPPEATDTDLPPPEGAVPPPDDAEQGTPPPSP